MEHNVVKTIIGAVALSSAAIAGPIAGPDIQAPPAPNSGSFCDTLGNIGKLYKNSDNPYIQEVSVFGRAHFTYAHVNGSDSAGNDFDQDFEEVRRARIGTKIKAFNGFELLFRANMVSDNKSRGGNDRDWGYQDFDEAYLSYNFGTIAGIDDVKLGYGRYKIAVGAESQQSSKKIKTVERSAISNKTFTNRYTGFLLSGKRGNVDATVGVLSLDDSDFVGNWDAGNAIFVDTTIKIGAHDYDFDALYNLDEGTADDQVGMDFLFASSIATERNIGGWNVLFNAIYGHNGDSSAAGAGDGGSFWGFIVLPSKFIVEDKVEAVFRYQYQGSSKQNGINTTRRYFGQAVGNSDGSGDNSPEGDQHHSIYAGLNYYFCGDHSKLMIGAEYENLSTPTGTADGTTLWAAYRMYF